MDRYTYKAKRKDNQEWVYGILIPYYDIRDEIYAASIISFDKKDIDSFGNNLIPVIPETLCQCTGLKDIEGKDIFENDWFWLKTQDIKYLVEWHDTGFSGRQYAKFNDKWLKCGSWVGLLGYCKGQCKIIGNKFDKEVK